MLIDIQRAPNGSILILLIWYYSQNTIKLFIILLVMTHTMNLFNTKNSNEY